MRFAGTRCEFALHLIAFAAEQKWFSGQGVQAKVALFLYSPGVHSVHSIAPGTECARSLHSEHVSFDDAAVTFEYVLPGH